MKRSLLWQLTLSFVAAATLVFLASSGFLYWLLASNLETLEGRLLDEKVSLFVQDQAREPQDYLELFSQLSTGSHNVEAGEYLVRILSVKGETLAETPGMAALLGPGAFPDIETRGAPTALERVQLPDGRVFKLRSAWSQVQGPLRKRVEVAVDCQRDEELLRTYGRWLVIVVLLGLASLAGLSLALVRRGLKPLGALGEVIRNRSAESLREPLDPRPWPPETRQVVEGFNDLSLRVHASFQRLSQFSADLAHELRTPIHNLRLQADVILARPRSLADYKAALESAQEEYLRLARMTESLLFLARAEHGHQVLQLHRFQVRPLAERVLQQFEASAQTKGLRLRLKGRGAVTADRDLLQQALGNLLANACAHTPSGGSVTLLIQALEPGLMIQVVDTGEGIPAQQLPQVFDRFFRGDPSRIKGTGSGLGLPLVRAIMDLHGGAVAVESLEGKGTTVTLKFSS